jgi:hypothetical protein
MLLHVVQRHFYLALLPTAAAVYFLREYIKPVITNAAPMTPYKVTGSCKMMTAIRYPNAGVRKSPPLALTGSLCSR